MATYLGIPQNGIKRALCKVRNRRLPERLKLLAMVYVVSKRSATISAANDDPSIKDPRTGDRLIRR